MSFSKKPTQPPGFDAGSAIKGLNTAWAKFPEWKRWVEATGDQDGPGLRDVVNANAIALDSIKTALDKQTSDIASLASRVSALETQPASPFPASG